MSDGLVLLGDTWIRVGFIESVYPIDKETPEDDYWAYGVRVRMITARHYTHWVDDVVGPARGHYHEMAKQKRDEFMDELMGNIRRAVTSGMGD